MVSVERMIESKDFMENPDKWPRWPQLPVVHRETKRSGFMLEGYVEVFLGNIWEKPNFDTMESEVFDSFDEVVEAGWEVD